jgi:predicted ArsR family transcriptional regulator
LEKVALEVGLDLTEQKRQITDRDAIREKIIEKLKDGKIGTLEELSIELKISKEALKREIDILIIKGKIEEKRCDGSCEVCPLKNFCLYRGSRSTITYYKIKS